MIKTAIMQRTDLPKSSVAEDSDESNELTQEEELVFRERFLVPKNCTIKDFKNYLCKCNLDDPVVVICTKAHLTSIPRDIKTSVKKIKLDYNLINNIDDVQWPKPLTNLVLIYNNLTHLKAKSFETVPNLSQLYLSHNNISRIDDEAFDGLKSLTRLSLESNKLQSFNMQILQGTPKITVIDLSENMINLPNETRFGIFKHLKEINLDHNRITIIRSHWFSNSSTLEWISLVYNKISVIEAGSFDGSTELAQLDLCFNKIKVINRQMFARNLNIKRLDLAGNPLIPLQDDAFNEIIHLKSLNLTDIEFDYIQPGTFSRLRELEFIYFSKFRYCHYANHVRVCLPSTDGLSSVKALLAFSILKYAVWIVAFVCTVGNVLVFIWRTISPNEDKTLSLFVKNLSIADLMMGVYLCVIGWQDWKFQNNFGSHAIEWMSSWTCTAIGFLAILSSELSVFILSIITIERYRCITSISKYHKDAEKQRARIYVALAWIFSFLIAFYPLFERITRKTDYFATNGLCLPLHIDQPMQTGWLYSAFIYLGINFSAVIIMIYLYAHMYIMIIDGRQTSRPVLLRSEKREDAILAIRFFFIVVTDCLCWIPIVVIKIMAFANVSISASIYGWLVVFIIPINSALNPILYTLAAPNLFRDVVCRLFERICYKIDLITAGSARGSNYSSQSSSTGSAHLDSAQQANGPERRIKNENSISTNTCDTFETSAISHLKSTADPAIVHLKQSSMIANHELYQQSVNGKVPKLFTSYTTLPIDDDNKFKSEINGKFYHEQYHKHNVTDNLSETIHRQIETKTSVNHTPRPQLDCQVNYVYNGDIAIKHELVSNQSKAFDGCSKCKPKQLVATLPFSINGDIRSVIVYDLLGEQKSFDDGGHLVSEIDNAGNSAIINNCGDEYNVCSIEAQPFKKIMHNCILEEGENFKLELSNHKMVTSKIRKRSLNYIDGDTKSGLGASFDNLRVTDFSNHQKGRVSFSSADSEAFLSCDNGSD